MEPMTLGSPVGSPPMLSNPSTTAFAMASPMYMGQNVTGGGLAGSNIATPGGGTGFLPGFLMGEYSQQGTGRMV